MVGLILVLVDFVLVDYYGWRGRGLGRVGDDGRGVVFF